MPSNEFDICKAQCFPDAVTGPSPTHSPSVFGDPSPAPTKAPTVSKSPTASFAPSPSPTASHAPTPTYCNWHCENLHLNHGGTELGQDGNCGGTCVVGIAADRNGVVWPELYLQLNQFYSGGDGFFYEDEGMPNQFDICKAQCFPDEPQCDCGNTEDPYCCYLDHENDHACVDGCQPDCDCNNPENPFC